MHLLLEGAHYSLVVPRESMDGKHAAHPEEEDGRRMKDMRLSLRTVEMRTMTPPVI